MVLFTSENIFNILNNKLTHYIYFLCEMQIILQVNVLFHTSVIISSDSSRVGFWNLNSVFMEQKLETWEDYF